MEVSPDVLYSKIDGLEKKLDEFIDRYYKDAEENREAHRTIRKELYGNGTEGLKYQVMKNSDMRKSISKFVWLFVSAVVVDLIGLLAVLLKVKIL